MTNTAERKTMKLTRKRRLSAICYSEFDVLRAERAAEEIELAA